MILIDTDVLIWHLRGSAIAEQALQAADGPALSAIGWMELVQGVRSKAQIRILRALVDVIEAPILPLTPAISNRAIDLIERHAPAHGMGVADALIAATALEHGATLLSGNRKHFEMVEKLPLQLFRAE